MLRTIQIYYQLTKPGIIYGNLIAAVAGFFLASKSHIHVGLFIAMLFGTALVIASACVFNNYIDRGIDEKMTRTKKRALVVGKVSGRNALIYGAILGIIGLLILGLFTNLLTVLVGFIGIFFYVVLYGFAKRRSVWSTLIGSIPGATPPVAGYLAVTNHIDIAAVLLFLILVFWQMPHFYAIGIYRLKEYESARLPILPVKQGIFPTQLQIVGFMAAFLVATLLFTIFHYTGMTYFIIMLVIGGLWLVKGVQGFFLENKALWARKIFLFSLIILLVNCLLLSINVVLP